MFFEDNLWVRGQMNGVAGDDRFRTIPGQFARRTANITVNNSLPYTNFNGSDTIALIAQNNINVGLASDDNLAIDAALIAQNGCDPALLLQFVLRRSLLAAQFSYDLRYPGDQCQFRILLRRRKRLSDAHV